MRIVCNLERPSELSWRARHGRKKNHQGAQALCTAVPVGSKGPHWCRYYPGMPSVWTWPFALVQSRHASLVRCCATDFSVRCFRPTAVRGDDATLSPAAGLHSGDAALTRWSGLHLCQVGNCVASPSLVFHFFFTRVAECFCNFCFFHLQVGSVCRKGLFHSDNDRGNPCVNKSPHIVTLPVGDPST